MSGASSAPRVEEIVLEKTAAGMSCTLQDPAVSSF